jgi:hypothetical protein
VKDIFKVTYPIAVEVNGTEKKTVFYPTEKRATSVAKETLKKFATEPDFREKAEAAVNGEGMLEAPVHRVKLPAINAEAVVGLLNGAGSNLSLTPISEEEIATFKVRLPKQQSAAAAVPVA